MARILAALFILVFLAGCGAKWTEFESTEGKSNRLYQLIAVGEEDGLKKDDIDLFFYSFSLL